MHPNILKALIRNAFCNIRFPEHCGINAANARDRWVSDARVLRRLTRKYDYRGPWWKVPDEHLENSLGFNYLDPKGVEFYLPALMILAIDQPSYGTLTFLGWELNPARHEDEINTYNYFKWRLSRIQGAKKEACLAFLNYLAGALRVFSTEEATAVQQALEHPFWRKAS
ncbi:MAG: DUF6714 family protein [Pseudomonadota bacterium]